MNVSAHPPFNGNENQRKLSRKNKKKKFVSPDFFSEMKSFRIQLLHDKWRLNPEGNLRIVCDILKQEHSNFEFQKSNLLQK